MIKLFESFTDLEDTKFLLMLKAIDTDNPDIVDFFVKKGYDIDDVEIFLKATRNSDSLRYLLKNGIDPNNYKNINDDRGLKDYETQKALMDYNYGRYIEKYIGFNWKIKEDPKYAELVHKIINKAKNAGKFNL